MKKCLLCGTVDEAGTAETCPMDGEASWAELESLGELVTEAAEDAPKKRGRK